MDIGLITGISLGGIFVLVSIFLAGDMDPQSVVNFIDAPSIMITIGGAIASVISSFPIQQFTGAMKSLGKIFKPATNDPVAAIKDIIELANIARKEGLLALDEKSEGMNEFLKKGIMFVVDGTDSELVKNVLEIEIAQIESRHKKNIEVWELIASQTPAWGMIGTLVGLVMMLQSLDDPSSIGPKMAVALITTFYGSLFANYLATPFANKMKCYSKEESLTKEIMVEGVLSIAAGENPRIIEEKLKVFVNPSARGKVGDVSER